MRGQGRLHIGKAHEERVYYELRRRGWHVQNWGQGLLDMVVRTALQAANPPVLWRWLPDHVAVRGPKIWLVDPKSEIRTDTPNVSIELMAWQTHLSFRPYGLPIIYVWSDLTCNTPERIQPVAIRTPAPGRERVSSEGSGTAFALLRKADQVPMDEWFGAPIDDDTSDA